MNIFLFGGNTTTGIVFQKLLKNQKEIKIFNYSRSCKGDFYFDADNPSSFKPVNGNNKILIVSFLPIWVFAKFLSNLYENYPKKLEKIDAILSCSSSSIETKKYSFSLFDKDLYKKLFFSENQIKSIAKSKKVISVIVRPALIYGSFEEINDKNLSILKKIIRKVPFILLPKNTGIRQPIHNSQLSYIFLYYVNEIFSNRHKIKSIEINVGGDVILNYHQMINKLINSSDKKNKLNCKVFTIPNRIFFFITSPILLFSPKLYAMILRIASDMGDFKKFSEITKKEPQDFPVKDMKN